MSVLPSPPPQICPRRLGAVDGAVLPPMAQVVSDIKVQERKGTYRNVPFAMSKIMDQGFVRAWAYRKNKKGDRFEYYGAAFKHLRKAKEDMMQQSESCVGRGDR